MMNKNIMGMPMNSEEVNPDGSYECTYISFKPMFKLMRSKNITDLEFAKKLGVKVDTIRNIQLNQDDISLKLIRNICHVLKCNPGDLMEARRYTLFPAKDE